MSCVVYNQVHWRMFSHNVVLTVRSPPPPPRPQVLKFITIILNIETGKHLKAFSIVTTPSAAM